MKVLITIILTMVSVCSIVAQTENQAGDSIRIALERERISVELTQLRDSIQQSLKTFDTQIKKSSTLKAIQLSTAKKELLGYQDQVKLDLAEITQTSQNGWGKDSLERLRSTMEANRRHHKRICTILKT